MRGKARRKAGNRPSLVSARLSVALLTSVVCVGSQAVLVSPGFAATTDEAEPKPSTLNALRTGRGTRQSVTVILQSAVLGEIMLHIEADGSVRVAKAALIDMLLPAIDKDKAAMSRLELMPETKGLVSLAALQTAGFSIGLDNKQLRLDPVPAPQPNISRQPNSTPTKRVSLIDMGLSSGGKQLGNIAVQVVGSRTVMLPKAALIDMLTPVFDQSVLAQLESLPEADGHVALTELKAAGFAVKEGSKGFDITRATSGTPSTPTQPTPTMPPEAPAPSMAAAAQPAEVPLPIGPEGRPVRLRHGGETLGEITLRSGTGNAVLLPKAALIDMLTPALEKDKETLTKLEAAPDSDGQVTLESLVKAGIEVRLVHVLIEFGKPVAAADLEAKGYAKPVSSRLNPTDRTIAMNVPLKDGDSQLAEIAVRIEPDGTILVPKAMLIQGLAPVLDKAALASLEKLPDTNGLIALGDLGGARFQLAYDPNQLELAFSPTVAQRAQSDLSLARPRASMSAQVEKPAIVSGYLNVIGGADYNWDGAGPTSLHFGQAAATSLYFELQSGVRVGSVVLENDGSVEGEVDPRSCPSGAACTYIHEAGFKRRNSRLVWDDPDNELRVQLGDVVQPSTTFQRSNDVLGVSIEKSPQKLAPGQRVGPVGRGSFSIERPSNLEILINGAVTQRLSLKPGNYNIRDLQLNAGANEIELIIIDDRNERRTLNFNIFSDGSMLAAGTSEWGMSGGVGSYFVDGERAYRPGDYLASSYYRYGAHDELTLEAQAKGDAQVVEGGMGMLAATPWGTWGLYGAASSSETGVGVAASVNWDLINFRGLLSNWRAERESLRLAIEYRTTEFRTPGEYVTTASGILYPQVPYSLRLSGSYSVPIAWGAIANLAARYEFADLEQIAFSPLVVQGDRYGADVTFSSPLGSSLSGSITAGISNETYRLSPTALAQEESADLRVMVRLFARPGDKTRLSASYDSLNKASSVSGQTGVGAGLGRWEGEMNLQNDGTAQRALANGSLAYSGNRGFARLAHTGSFDGVEWEQSNPTSQEQRTSLRFGTALAFADSHFAVGQLVRGGAFAIVHPHESLAGKEITVGAQGDVRARVDGWGSALVSDVPAYSRSNIPVDVADLPVGYSLGAGNFELLAPYRAGYALEVGSSSAVSAYGTLLLADSSPAALITGIAHPINNPLKTVSVFTNKVGRFSAEGLSPGRWVIEMATDGAPTRYEIEVPQGTDGVFVAGDLRPVGTETR